jgi:hypothetical protein
VHDGFNVAALGAASVEFAIGIGAGTAFAKTPVAVGVYYLGAGQPSNVQPAFFDGFAPLQEDGLDAQFEGAEGGKKAGRASPYNDNGRPVLAVLIGAMIVGGNIFLAAIELHSGMVKNAATAGVKALSDNLNMG